MLCPIVRRAGVVVVVGCRGSECFCRFSFGGVKLSWVECGREGGRREREYGGLGSLLFFYFKKSTIVKLLDLPPLEPSSTVLFVLFGWCDCLVVVREVQVGFLETFFGGCIHPAGWGRLGGWIWMWEWVSAVSSCAWCEGREERIWGVRLSRVNLSWG